MKRLRSLQSYFCSFVILEIWLIFIFLLGLQVIRPGFLALFYMGFWRYMNTWGGGVKSTPLIKSEKNDYWNLVKRHFLAKIDCVCSLLMHLKLNYYHFWLKKGQKNWRRRGSNRGIEGSPLWIICGKNCRHKILWNFQKEIPRMAYPGPF